MKAPGLPVPFELHRLRHAAGQALKARDFRDDLAVKAQLRWWHNRAKHDAYGRVEGLRATLEGNAEGRAVVRVTRGMAYDCFGREIIVCRPLTLAVPDDVEADQSALLWLSAADGTEPALRWDASGKMNVKAGVPVARLRGTGSKGRNGRTEWTLEPISYDVRSASRARSGRGATISGATSWADWEEEERYFGVQARIDTTAVGFAAVPHYFAHMRGAPLAQGMVSASLSTNGPRGLCAYVGHIAQEAAGGFTYRVFIPISGAGPPLRAGFREMFRRNVSVCWIGFEAQFGDPCQGETPR